ncbi:MAG: glycosyltransferase family 4 protein [Alphaproteobacteria bacterium]|nr:glycosyltransferase family 4 protein [Alphaproteobacteria bacterium]
MKPLKIAYLVTRMDEYGGPQIHVRDLSIWLQGQGHQPLVLSGWAGVFSDEVQASGIDYREIPFLGRPIDPIKDVKAFLELRRVLKSERPDLLSCHSSKAGWIGRFAAWSCGIPVVFTAHGWAFTKGIPLLQKILYMGLEKFAGYFCNHVITVSQYDRDLALRYHIVAAEKMTAVHNGMPNYPAPLRAKREGPVRLMMVARVAPQKDHERLLRVLWGCLDLDWTLDLVGSGDDLHLRQMVDRMGYTDRVNFMGERGDVGQLLDNCADVFLLVSNWEGFPRSILEAMRSALPVIASDVGGVREAVQDGVTGFVVPAGQDDPLLHALRVLIADRDLQLRMGAAGRAQYDAEFTFLAMASKTFAVYQKVLAHSKTPAICG